MNKPIEHTPELEHALGQFFDVPITYNPLIAKALRSTKAAILLDYLIELESMDESVLSHSQMAQEVGLGLTEVKTALLILESASIVTKHKASMSLHRYEVNPFYMNDLLGRLESYKAIEGHLTFDLMNPIAVNRLYMQTLKSLGAGANSCILLSFLLGHLSDKDRTEHPNLSDWFESNDSVWLGMTGMSEKELRNAKKSLRELGLIERKRTGMPSKLYLRLNMKKLADDTWAHAQQNQAAHRVNKAVGSNGKHIMRAYA